MQHRVLHKNGNKKTPSVHTRCVNTGLGSDDRLLSSLAGAIVLATTATGRTHLLIFLAPSASALVRTLGTRCETKNTALVRIHRGRHCGRRLGHHGCCNGRTDGIAVEKTTNTTENLTDHTVYSWLLGSKASQMF